MSILRSACADDTEYLTALRDSFAVAALSGFSVDGTSDPANWNWKLIASHAWTAADAMMAVRGSKS